MRELPKAARERLAAGPVSTPHLDSNLVAALVENALLPGERRRVIAHMAVCSQCRSEVQLVISASRPEAQATQAVGGLNAESGSGRGGFSWQRLLRWQPITAAAGLLTLALAFWVATRRPTSHGVRPAAASPTVASNAAPAPPAPGVPETAGTPSQSPSPAAEAKQAIERTPTGRHKATAKFDVTKGGELQAPSEAPTPLAGGNTAATSLEAQATPAETVVAAAPPPPAPAARAQPARAALQPAPAQSLPVDIESKAAPARGVARAPAVLSVRNNLAAGSAEASRSLALHVTESLVRWAVTANATLAQSNPGAVEKSLDGGRTWRQVPVAPGVKFRVVFASGQDVWAGGVAGAFYHSSDGGERWSPVPLVVSSGAVMGDIVSIQFADASHGVVSASSGQTWTTSDGGRTWQVQ